ncbi:MAG TPA: hypothetical protein VM389_14510, partial [Phycisphaerae bacterium]|nr:hypothetical protein [Phycisphaerae bacterium]
VDLFSAIGNKQLDVKFVAKGANECVVRITNDTPQAVNVRLPDAFVGEPVVKDYRDYGGRTQAVGGGFHYETPEMMARDDDGSFVLVGPGKQVELAARTVCLDPGLPVPRPDLPYQIKPIEGFARNPAVHELCRMLSRPAINQKAAQAAAWHLDDGLGWPALAAMRTRTPRGRTIPLFGPSDIRIGRKLAAQAVQLAQQRRKQQELAARKQLAEQTQQ